MVDLVIISLSTIIRNHKDSNWKII